MSPPSRADVTDLRCSRFCFFAALKKLIYDYVDFCAAELERKDLLNAYDEKGILNMKLYTKEDGDRRVKELEEKIRNWCGEEALKKVL